jgi:hypothetical protein
LAVNIAGAQNASGATVGLGVGVGAGVGAGVAAGVSVGLAVAAADAWADGPAGDAAASADEDGIWVLDTPDDGVAVPAQAPNARAIVMSAAAIAVRRIVVVSPDGRFVRPVAHRMRQATFRRSRPIVLRPRVTAAPDAV